MKMGWVLVTCQDLQNKLAVLSALLAPDFRPDIFNVFSGPHPLILESKAGVSPPVRKQKNIRWKYEFGRRASAMDHGIPRRRPSLKPIPGFRPRTATSGGRSPRPPWTPLVPEADAPNSQSAVESPLRKADIGRPGQNSADASDS